MIYPLDPTNLLHASAADFILTGADILEDTTDRLILGKEGLIYGLGRADLSPVFRSSLMALCFDPEAAESMLHDAFFDDDTLCYQFVYTGSSIDIPKIKGFELIQLTEDFVPFLTENYHHPSATERHMTERIRSGMLGAFCDGKIAGFIGTHEEGAIGMLEVMPEFRRMGVAKLLESAMIDKLLKCGRIPYTHVKTGNLASIRLQQSIGLQKAPATVRWLCKDAAYRQAHLT